MVAARATQRYTPAEYLAMERQAETKSEYIDGCIVARPPVNRTENRIALGVLVALDARLRIEQCEVFGSGMRIANIVSGRYIYPDASVVCGEPHFEHADDDDTLLNPTLIVEVLSPSTEAYDRGDKFADYRRLPSLHEYVLIAQDRPSIEHYLRQGEQWLLTAVTDLDAAVSLPTIGCVLQLRDVYRRVRFDAAATSP
ncbi:MAG: Uma2 family endonuclease [Dehalococcoidia bacterium]